ncbi:ATP-binding protein [Halorussus limi]|uniref:ATP-binding protein n=2 Tax=Halorussus TaxID=1070314 RepID=A0A8U0IIS8_9EURY|nr:MULTISPECIES: ATP-binding protein [Halorussus]UPV73948.1 ATP-binding protein [Halorussus limi]UPV99988.1 ATP-binding protein [Halorussus gelatinilyticus]
MSGKSSVVGTVAGPGDDPNEFVFVTPADKSIKTGEFITYTVSVDGGNRSVLARVTNRELIRGLPEGFLADPEVGPDTVAATLGVPTDDTELYRLTATVIGYYDTEMTTFANPRQLPAPGTPLSIAPDQQLETVLPNLGCETDSTDVTELEGTAHLGWLLNRSPKATNIHIPIEEFASTHLAILASTGSGKSYTASVLIEEMMGADSRASLLVFDPHGEYDTLAEMQGNEAFRGEDGYEPEVVYYDPERLRVRISELEIGDVMAVLDNPSNRMQERLSTAWRAMQRQESRTWGIDELIGEMEARYGEDDASVGALEWRLRQSIERNDLFHPEDNVPLNEIVDPGQCTVLQMDTLDRWNQQLITTVLLRRMYRERLDAVRDRDSQIEHPLFALFEEGHRFAPASGDAPSLGIMRTITSEGRKFGFGLGIISQRPSKIDQDVLSQCGTQISMQIKNPNDQDAIKNSVEAAGEDVLRELPGLTPGQAVVSGDAMNTPALIQVRQRRTSHGAGSRPVIEEWRDAYDQRQREPTQSEAADFGEGDSTGVQSLD